VLSSLLEGILPQARLGLGQSRVNLLQLISGVVDLLSQHVVLFLEFLVLIPLLWVQIVQSCLVVEVDLLDLALVGLDLGLHVSLLTEEVIQVRPLLIVLALNVHIQGLNVLWLGIASEFI